MPKMVVLGNCVAERLTLLLKALLDESGRYCPSLAEHWEVVHVAPVHNTPRDQLDKLAATALQCDCVFSQPLFNFGPCNTDILRQKLGPRLHTFSAPNFEAYFPDVMDIRPYSEPLKFDPPMEWHSRIIVKCYQAGVPPDELDGIYPAHPLFKREHVKEAIARSLHIYERRETDVEIGSLDFVRANYLREPLFYTWNHPGDGLFRHLLLGILQTLGLNKKQREDAVQCLPWAKDSAAGWSEWGFGFSAWPIITRWHDLFNFPGREWFRIGGEQMTISTAALGWYRFYAEHPEAYQKVLAAAQKE